MNRGRFVEIGTRDFTLSTQELSELLRISHCAPFPDSPFSQVPPAAETSGIMARLISEGIVDEKGEALSTQWKEIFDTLAEPSWELTLLSSGEKFPGFTRFYPLRAQNFYIAYAQAEGNLHNISFPHTRQDILNRVQSQIPDTQAPRQILTDLPFREFVALLSIIDLFRTFYLDSYIERRREFLVEFTSSDLFYIYDKGLHTNDFRWCVTAGRIFSPIELYLIKERLDDVLNDMTARSLVKSAPSKDEEPAWGLTDTIEKLCNYLLDISMFLAFKAQRLRPEKAHFSISAICGKGENLLFSFNEVPPNVHVDISSCEKARFADYMNAVFKRVEETVQKPVEVPHNKCVRCSSEIPVGERFCTFCGTAVASASAVTPEKESAPVTATLQVEKQKPVICSHCKTENFFQAHFCKDCGRKLVQDVYMACPQCNKQVKSESRFCRFCGCSFTQEAPHVAIPKEAAPRFGPDSKGSVAFRPCPQCGKQVKHESRFCRFCGFNFEKK